MGIPNQAIAALEPLEPRQLLAAAAAAASLDPEFDKPLFAVNNHTVFDVSIGGDRREMWSFDGTHSVPLLSTSINGPGELFSVAGNSAYFSNQNFNTGEWTLYKTDGTTAGTSVVRNLGTNQTTADMISAMVVSGSKLYFIAEPSANDGADLWVSDGTSAGTNLLHHFPGYYAPSTLNATANNSIYFIADDDRDEVDLTVWKSDGTAAGTVPISINLGQAYFGVYPNPEQSLIDFDGFAAWVGDYNDGFTYPPISAAIWLNDGQGVGGQDDQFVLQADGTSVVQNVTDIFVAGGKLYFAAGYQYDTEAAAGLFVLNSPTAKPKLVQPLDDTVDGIDPVGTLNGRFLYIYQGQLYSTDGTTVSPPLATTGNPDDQVTVTAGAYAGSQLQYFVDGYLDLWRTDGASSGNTEAQHFSEEVKDLVGLPDGGAYFTDAGTLYHSDGSGTTTIGPITALRAPAGNSTIAGNVFDDPNANGIRDVGEKALRGYKVFLDRNRDGVCNKSETWTRASSTGRYTFSNLAPGKYCVRIVGVEGRRPSTAEQYLVRLAADQTVIRSFGRSTVPLVYGTVYLDPNHNGKIDSTESRLAGWTVYVDRVWSEDLISMSILSLTTDATGGFTVPNLPAGNYRIRVVGKSGYRLTSPANGYRFATVAPGVLTRAIFGLKRVT